MAKKRIDFSKIKELMLEKGERIGLIAVGVVTVLVLFLGIFGPLAPSTSPPASAKASNWPTAIMQQVKSLDERIKVSEPTSKDIAKGDARLDDFPPGKYASGMGLLAPRLGLGQVLSASARFTVKLGPGGGFAIDLDPQSKQFDFLQPWYESLLIADDKRVNPPILPVATTFDDNIRDLQIDYFPAPALVYEIDFAAQKFGGIFSGKNLLKKSVMLEPKRMVVVSCSFPIKEQLELFRQSLRYPSVAQMLAKGEGPHFLGLNIWRSHLGRDGKEIQAVPLYNYDPKAEKTVVGLGKPAEDKFSDVLDKFFRQMLIDDANPQLAAYLGPNMVTPLPKLASVGKSGGSYPPVRLTWLPPAASEEPEPDAPIDVKKPKDNFPKPKGDQPKKATPFTDKQLEGVSRMESWKTLERSESELVARLRGDYNPFDPLAKPFKGKDGKEKKEDMKKGLLFKTTTRTVATDEDKERKEEITRLLVRFIDVEAEVGKSYRYYIQVRVANPNYGKEDEVAYKDLARNPELGPNIPWAWTHFITIPPESFFYAVDQQMLVGGLETKPMAKGSDKEKVDHEKTTVQLHRWVTQTGDQLQERLIGDWAVAERLVVRRGEPIGRTGVLVELPEWNPKTARFEFGFHVPGKGKAPKPGGPNAIPVDFVLNTPPPLLVDFEGGRHEKYKFGRSYLKDDAAVEMLVLNPDGSLGVRSSRVDSDPKTDNGRQRVEHYNRWRNRVREVRNQSGGGEGASSAFPQ